MLGVPTSLDDVAIVLKGNFNPSILSPSWLLAQGVIGAEEHEQADVEVITRDIASFTCAWLKLFSSGDTLQISTAVEAEFERLRDAAIAILTALPHTPVGALGINRNVHFRVDSLDDFHQIGDILAPKVVWDGVLELAGMRSLTMWGAREGAQAGRVQVTVEPSSAIPQAVFVGHNDHYELFERDHHPESRNEAWIMSDRDALDATPGKLSIAVSLLTDEWHGSMSRADSVIQRVHEQARS